MKTVIRKVKGMPASDGAGVKLTRVLGQPSLKSLDPFLLLDEFRSDNPDDYGAGFPMHPHRGFETVTYLLKGRFRHRDNQGNEGVLNDGDIQWMTAGRGIVHEEMPLQKEGDVWGFQLWVNLPASQKMAAPRYQDIRSERVPEVLLESGSKVYGLVRVLAGSFQGVTGPVEGIYVEPDYLDVHLNKNGRFVHQISAGKVSFLYVYQGEVEVGAVNVKQGELAALDTTAPDLVIGSADGSGFLLISAWPIKEPIVQYGPFVMNTVAEVEQAIQDFNAGKF